MTSEKSYAGWYFLLAVIVIYIITLIVSSDQVMIALGFFLSIIMKIIPVFLLIFVLLIVTNYYIKPNMLVKYLGKKSGIKGWLIAILAGILSTGPIYMWYPFLNDLQKQGVRHGLIAAFLYNRAVKIPLLPMLFVYFGLTYSIVLLFVMIIMSIIQGLATEKFMGVKI